MTVHNDLNILNNLRRMLTMRLFEAVKFFLRRYWHAFLFLIFIVLTRLFFILEDTVVPEHWVSVGLDRYIPFVPVFAVPYLIWFPLIAVGLMALCFHDRSDFARTIILLYAGMSAALLTYLVFPHGQPLRPDVFGNDFFSLLVRSRIYANDTNTNCFPSIHVLNQLSLHIGLCKSKLLRGRPNLRRALLAVTVLVCSSTVLIKQHSVADVAFAVMLEIPLYFMVFKVDWKKVFPFWQGFSIKYARMLKLHLKDELI